MHRPGIAKVVGNHIILDGTTADEVAQYHHKTLELAIEKTNEQYLQVEARQRHEAEVKQKQEEKYNEGLKNSLKLLKFN